MNFASDGLGRPRMLLLAAAAALLGLQGQTLTGVVLDPSGAPVPGCLVSIKGPAIAPRTSHAGFDGAFQFDGLPEGVYEVIVEKENFRRHTGRLRVPARGSARARVRLRLADLRQEITITDIRNQVSAQAADNLDVVRLDRKLLESLPAIDNDIVAAAARFLDPLAGAGGIEVVVDGMPTSEKAVTRSAIQEVRINQNTYSAEYAYHGRTRIEVITSPGSTDYHGGFGYNLRDHHFDARNAFAAARPRSRTQEFEGNFTGPIGDGRKTSFLVTADHEPVDAETILLARTPAGDVRRNFPFSLHESFVSARLNRQVNSNNQLALRYEFTDTGGRNLGVGGFSLPEAAFNTTNREHHVYVQHRAVLSPRLVYELQLRSGRHNNPVTSVVEGVPKIVVQAAFTSGGAQADRRFTENHAQLHGALSWNAGRHFLKFGATSPDLSRRGQTDRTNFDGTFHFSSLDDYLAGRPFSFQRQRGDGHFVLWQKELALFILDDFRVRPSLSLNYGLRWDVQDYYGDHNNLGPRFAFAWAPRSSKKTVLRGGAGYFYERTTWQSKADTIRYDGRRLAEILIRNPGFPAPLSGLDAGAVPPNIVRFSPGMRTPYTLQFSFSVERQLDKSSSIAATYRRSKSTGNFRSRNVNAPLPGTFRIPDLSIGVLRQFESSAASLYHGFDIHFRGSAGKYFNGSVQYLLSRGYNNSDGINAFPADNYDLSRDWGPNGEHRLHRLNLAGNIKASTWLNLGMLLSTASPYRYNITTGRDDNRDGFATDRPPGIRRNSQQGVGFLTLDLRWSRDFALNAKKREKGPVLTAAVDAFNVPNTVNVTSIVGNQSSPFFGQPVMARPARRLQFSLRLKF